MKSNVKPWKRNNIVSLLLISGAFLVGICLLANSTLLGKFLEKPSEVCKPDYVKLVSTDERYKFEFCYPKNWKMRLDNNTNATPGNNVPSFDISNEKGNGIEYIQGQIVMQQMLNFREEFYSKKSLNQGKYKDLGKILVMEDTDDKFVTLERDIDDYFNTYQTIISAYIINPANKNQVMRMWYFYSDGDSTESVKRESRIFNDIVNTFKWDE